MKENHKNHLKSSIFSNTIAVLLIVVLFLPISGNVYGQWQRIYSDTTGNITFTSVFFVNNDTGFVVGYDYLETSDVILKTTDGGANWMSQGSGINDGLASVYFLNADSGFAVGWYGKVIQTKDGGSYWDTSNYLPYKVSYSAIHFPSSEVGYIVGSPSIIAKTNYGGLVWETIFQDTNNYFLFNDVYFIDDSIGFVIGGENFTYAGIIFKTTDGGATWDTTLMLDYYPFTSIQFINSTTGFIGGYGAILKTSDGGTSWEEIFVSPMGNEEMTDISFIDQNTGYAISTYGSLLKTINSGQDWYTQSVLTSDLFESIQFLDINTGYLVSSSGKIYKTTNGGGNCPTAKFTATPDIGCELPISISFTDLSTDTSGIGIASWQWEWGDGNILTTDSSQDWVHAYAEVLSETSIDTIHITLTVTNNIGCQSSYTDSIYISDDCIWPGDANKDATVNNKDLLEIGLLYGSNGITRTKASSLWDGQLSLNWNDTMKNGANYKHVDCNGDGTIDKNDAAVISANYNQRIEKRSSSQPYNPASPDLYFEIANDTIAPGDTVKVKIMFGSTTTEATDIYGLVFSLSYNSGLIDSNSANMNFDNSWIGTVDTDMIYIAQDIYSSAKMDVGITRIDHKTKSGNGELGEFTFVTIDNLAGGIIEIKFEDVSVIDTSGDIVPVNTVKDTLQVIGIQKDYPTIEKRLNIFPNPAQNTLSIEQNALSISNIQLFNIIGESVYIVDNSYYQNKKINIDLQNIPTGIYFLSIDSKQGSMTRKVNVVK